MRTRLAAGLAAVVAVVLTAACSGGTDGREVSARPVVSGPVTANPAGTLTATPTGNRTFGPDCPAMPTDPAAPGSAQNLARTPLGTAVANNPQLSTLTTAIVRANLTGTLDSAKALTAFAPTNEAFTRLSQGDLTGLANSGKLKGVILYHVLGQRLAPSQLAGTHRTQQGADLTVTGHGADFMVNKTAKIVCGNIQAANATVYLIDTVLMPPG